MTNSIKYTQNKQLNKETYSFLEDGKEVHRLIFSSWNRGNLASNIVSEQLSRKIAEMKERGWIYESLDAETQVNYGVFFEEHQA
jgi:6-phosphogluconate dehydrogenase